MKRPYGPIEEALAQYERKTKSALNHSLEACSALRARIDRESAAAKELVKQINQCRLVQPPHAKGWE
jgi:uncharacterized protein YPO0396